MRRAASFLIPVTLITLYYTLFVVSFAVLLTNDAARDLNELYD